MINQVGRELRERATRHEATTEDEARLNHIAWRERDLSWERLCNQRWEHARCCMERDPWTRGDIRRIQEERKTVARKGWEDERCPPGLSDEVNERQQRVEGERQLEMREEIGEDGLLRLENNME